MKGDQPHICMYNDTELLHKYSGPLIRQFKIVIPLPNIIPWLNLKVTFKSHL